MPLYDPGLASGGAPRGDGDRPAAGAADAVFFAACVGTMFGGGVGYISLSPVAETSADELKSEITSMKGKGMKSLVLDLRLNPGGLLDQGIKVADLFLDQKQEIVRTLTDAMVGIEGENMRSVTWCVVEEVTSGDWGIGGQPLTTVDVRTLARGVPA